MLFNNAFSIVWASRKQKIVLRPTKNEKLRSAKFQALKLCHMFGQAFFALFLRIGGLPVSDDTTVTLLLLLLPIVFVFFSFCVCFPSNCAFSSFSFSLAAYYCLFSSSSPNPVLGRQLASYMHFRSLLGNRELCFASFLPPFFSPFYIRRLFKVLEERRRWLKGTWALIDFFPPSVIWRKKK